jgi:O-antigen/teichoic acid export membrane protein
MVINKKQFIFNAASGWITQLVVALVGFILMPYIIRHLGEQGYGIYQLAKSALVFFMFLQLGMGPTLVRFFAKAIAKDDKEEIRSISSTAQFLLGGLGLATSLLYLILTPFFIRFYNIPPEFVQETTWLLICMSLSLFLNMTFIVPQGIVFGVNRYDLANLIGLCENLMRLLFIMILFEVIRPSIFLIGLSILLTQLLKYIALFAVAFKSIGKVVLFSFQSVTKEMFRRLFGFGMLNLANSVAAAVVFQGPVLIIGKVLGKEMVTAFAPALLISFSMQGFLGQVTAPLVPLASSDREGNNGARLGELAISMGRVAAFIGFGIVLPLATFGPEVMRLWLGDNLAWTWNVVVVMTTGIAISQVQAANYYLALGGGDIKPSVYSQIVMAVTVFSGTLIGTVWFEWHLLAVAFYIGVCILVRNTFYLSYAYSIQFSYKFGRYLWLVYGLPVLITTVCSGSGWILKIVWPPKSVLLLTAEATLVLSGYLLLCWFFMIPKQIKQKLIHLAKSKVNLNSASVKPS